MFKRALGADSYSVKTKKIVETDTVLTNRQKRRVLNSLLPYAVLSIEEMNELEGGSSEDEIIESEAEPLIEKQKPELLPPPEDTNQIIYNSGEGSFRVCRLCPGKRMLTDEDVTKHVESKQHLKKMKQNGLSADQVTYIKKETAEVKEVVESDVDALFEEKSEKKTEKKKDKKMSKK